jgi:hypothetical protein
MRYTICVNQAGYTVVIEWLSEIWRDFDSNIIIRSFEYCGRFKINNVRFEINNGRQKVLTNYADDFYDADGIYGFANDDSEELNDLDADAVDMEIMETILDDIPNGEAQPISPSASESISPTTSEATANNITPPDVPQAMELFLLQSTSYTNFPLENVTNILNSASSLLPQTSTTNSSNKENAPKAPTTGAKRGPKPLTRDPVTGMITRPCEGEGNLIAKTRKPKNNKENGK